MSAPKCRLCGTVHWNHEPHKFEDEARIIIKDKSSFKEVSRPETKDKSPVICADSFIEKEKEYKRRWRDKNLIKLREYQREYMRNRRAKAKENAEQNGHLNKD